MPLPAMENRNGGPPPSPSDGGAATRTATAMRTGIPASTNRITWLRRRRNTIPSSERRNRELTTGARTGSTSTADIEALPGQRHEHVLKAGRVHGELPYRHGAADQRGQHALRLPVAEQRRDPPAVP